MSLTDGIGADIQAMAAGVDRTQQEAGAVDHTVEQITARAVASGFAGIAVGLARARQVLQQARSRLAQAGGILGEASRSLSAVPQQPSPQETIAALTPVVAALTAVDSHVAAAGSAVDDTPTAVDGDVAGRTTWSHADPVASGAAGPGDRSGPRDRSTTTRRHGAGPGSAGR